MKAHYIVYDKNWNKIGYSDQQQHPGQPATTEDFPVKCPQCGAGILGVGQPWWLKFRGYFPVDMKLPDRNYIAWCDNKHVIEPTPIEELISAQNRTNCHCAARPPSPPQCIGARRGTQLRALPSRAGAARPEPRSIGPD